MTDHTRTTYPDAPLARAAVLGAPITTRERATVIVPLTDGSVAVRYHATDVASVDADGHTYTLEEVGKIFKVTRERVRQIEAKAIRKLQHPVRSRKLEGFLDNVSVSALLAGELGDED